MVALDGQLEPEAGQSLLAALEPWPAPPSASDTVAGPAAGRRPGRAGPPGPGGRAAAPDRRVRPQLTVTVDLDSLQGRTRLGGGTELGPLAAEGCQRLACDSAVTRVLVTRQPTSPPPPASTWTTPQPGRPDRLAPDGSGLAAPDAGWGPDPALEVGRTTRVVQPGQRLALAVRDGGCVFPGCDRPLAWYAAHHLWHWVDGGPTDLANLVLLCRAHHRAVHDGGWQLTRQPDGRLSATPPQRPPRRQPSAA